MENLKNYLFELCSENAPSGREEYLTCLERLVRPFADKCYRDVSGNLVAVKYCKIPGAEKILIDAHIDEVGLVVTQVDDNGFVRFANHAGISDKILPASTVTVLGKRSLTGVVATLPPHLLKDSDTDKVIHANEMVIDVGLDADEARELISVGDFITLRSTCQDLQNNLVVGKSFDNRACASVLINVLSTLTRVRPKYDVYAVFSAAEEFGGYGASTAAFDIAPDIALVLDATFGISPFTSKSKGKELGGGPAIGISPVLDTHLGETLVGISRTRGIPFQREVMNGRTYTNADNILTSRTGVPTALLSLPLRYMHSAAEVVSLEDMKYMSHMIISYIEYRGGAVNE